MKVAVNNIDRNLRAELSQLCEIVGIDDSPRGVFMAWTTPEVDDLFVKQTKIIEKCVKNKIPMIIFDKNGEITPEEVTFLIGEGAFLWEPAVTGRSLFSYQPCWGRIHTDFREVPSVDADKRHIHLCNCSTLARKFPSFEKYYIPVHEIGSHSVVYIDRDNSDTIRQKVDKYHIPIMSKEYGGFDNIRATVLLGSEKDYETGYLDPMFFQILENGIIPLLPEEHRWYHSVFGGLTMNGETDIDYILQTYDKIAFGCVYEIYENLNIYLPESNVVNVAKRITNYFK